MSNATTDLILPYQKSCLTQDIAWILGSAVIHALNHQPTIEMDRAQAGYGNYEYWWNACRTLEGEPERSAHACRTRKEQLHSHHCHQNMTGQYEHNYTPGRGKIVPRK